MFNHKLRKDSMEKHKCAVDGYNNLYDTTSSELYRLYRIRKNAIEELISIENLINSISNSPKEFEKTMSIIKNEIKKFTEAETLAKQSYEDLKKAGIGIAAGAAIGTSTATMGSNILLGIATTFGKAATGTAIKGLSGAAAKKAAIAWVGRLFSKLITIQGAGMAAGNAVLALVGPIGWGLTAISLGGSLFSLSKKNKKAAEKINTEIEEIIKLKNELYITKSKIDELLSKTRYILNDILFNKEGYLQFSGSDYSTLSVEDKYKLGVLVNNAHSLSLLISTTIGEKEKINE